MQRKIVLFLATLMILFVFCGSATAATVKNNTTSSSKIHQVEATINQIEPAISGYRVVWMQNNIKGIYNVYMKNLATGKTSRVHASIHNQNNPAIDGNRIVWEEGGSGLDYIYIYDLKTGKTNILHTSNKFLLNPAISGTRIVWVEPFKLVNQIYCKDLISGRTNIVHHQTTSYQYNPSISGTRIVWKEAAKNGKYTVCCKDLLKGTTNVVTRYNGQGYPKISGTRIIWQGLSNRNYCIFTKDLSNGKTIIVNADLFEYQLTPDVSGNIVVWLHESNGWWNVYYKNLANNKQGSITTEQYGEAVTISGRTVVWIKNVNEKRILQWKTLT